MQLQFFNGADESPIVNALRRNAANGSHVASVKFRAETARHFDANEMEQWLTLCGLLGRREVYESLGIKSLPGRAPCRFNLTTGLETIGTIANLLMVGSYFKDVDDALQLSRGFLDVALRRDYLGALAYSASAPWCDWFYGEQTLDETVLLGYRGEWLLITVTNIEY